MDLSVLDRLPQKTTLDILGNRENQKVRGRARAWGPGTRRTTWSSARPRTGPMWQPTQGLQELFFLLFYLQFSKVLEKGLVVHLYKACLSCDCTQRGSWRNWLPVVLKALPPPLLILHPMGIATKGTQGRQEWEGTIQRNYAHS